MDEAMYDDLLQRLTALVVKLDQSYDKLVEFVAEQHLINDRLTTLMERVFQQQRNGHED